MYFTQHALGERGELGPEKGGDVEQRLPTVATRRAAEVEQHFGLRVAFGHAPSKFVEDISTQLATIDGGAISTRVQHATLHQQAARCLRITTTQYSGEVLA